jgi:hypothetical protein
MTLDQARYILNMVRAGFAVPLGIINRALVCTGDLSGTRFG